MECRNHPGTSASDRCAGCQEPFCPRCLVTVKGRSYCASCKVMALEGQTPILEKFLEPCQQAKEALIYAAVGIVCLFFVFEPVAIVKAMAAKKAIAANPNLTGSGKANAALTLAIAIVGLWVIRIVEFLSKI